MTCSVDACGKKVRARGLCEAHLKRWRRHGDPQGGKAPANKVVRQTASTLGFPCPTCGGRTEVKDSRHWHGYIRRRRVCAVSTPCPPFSTVEVPESIFDGLDAGRVSVLISNATEALNGFIAKYNVARRAIRRSQQGKPSDA